LWRLTSIGIISDYHPGEFVVVSEPFIPGSTCATPHYVLVVDLDGSTLKIVGLTEHKVRTYAVDGRQIPIKMSTVLPLRPRENKAKFSIGSFSLLHSENKFEDISPIVATLARLYDIFVKKNLESEGVCTGNCPTLSQLSPLWGKNKHGIASALYPTLWKKLVDTDPKDFVYALAVHALASPQARGSIESALVYLASAVVEVAHSDWTCLMSDMYAGGGQTLPGIGSVKEVYMCCAEPGTMSYFGAISGTVAKPGLERAMIWHALASAKHRNCYEEGDESELYEPVFVLSTPSLAITRASMGCASCKSCCCPQSVPLVHNGGVYLMFADIKLIASRTLVHRFQGEFTKLLSAIPECAGIGDIVECTCNTITGGGGTQLCPRCKLITSAISLKNGQPPTKKRVGRYDENQLPDDQALAEKFVTHCGMAGVLALGRRAHIMRQTLVRCTDALLQKFGPFSFQQERHVDVDQQLLSTLSRMDSASSDDKVGIPPHFSAGYKNLVDANWDPMSFAKYAAPCVLKLLWECAGPEAKQHPKYEERWHLLSFFLSFPQLLDNYTGLLTMWRKLFAKHADPTERGKLLDTPYFMASKYGNTLLENAITCAKTGRRWGCPKAVDKGVCPFSSATESITARIPTPDQVVKEITDIEDIRVKLVAPFSPTRVPEILEFVTQHCVKYDLTDKVSICKCMCSVVASDLTRREEKQSPAMRMVISHSIDFYRALHSFTSHTKK
jgi:hypothetical protein